MHVHPISKGKCRESFEEVKNMVVEEILHTPNVTSSAIVLVASKMFLFCHLFNEDGKVLAELLKGEKFNQTMLMFVPLHSPNIHNLISLFKHRSRNMESLDSILVLKSLSPYDYIWDNCFFGQQYNKNVYLFKMSIERDDCGVDLVKWIQPRDDLEKNWMMFDHVKHVQRLDGHGLPCLWPYLLQNNVYCYLWYVVRRHWNLRYTLEEVECHCSKERCNKSKFQRLHGR